MKFFRLLVSLFFISLSFSSSFAQAFLRGNVSCDGKGLGGVVVSDGYRCVQTNEKGDYSIPTLGDRKFVFLSTPSGYLVPREGTIPQFFKRVDLDSCQVYNFTLEKNPLDDHRHLFIAQADVQVANMKDLDGYKDVVKDCKDLLSQYSGVYQFSVDCGDIVADHPDLYPSYIETTAPLDIPIFRAMGNHDMKYYGRTHETSFSNFENYFGPVSYSFNKGKAHYIILDNNFFIGRDYFYMGYIDEKTFQWLEQDLSYVPSESLVFVIMHIPSQLSVKQEPFKYNSVSIASQTVNSKALHQLFERFNTHIITGHMHYNFNLNYSDKLMEHNTAAVCAAWWCTDICLDGTPRGYGVYEVNGTDLKWQYKSSGYPLSYQFRASRDEDQNVIVNVWNWDEAWKVEWIEDGVEMGAMEQFEGYDPLATQVCAGEARKIYSWIAPVKTKHLFKAHPNKKNASIEIRVTDRFGTVYTQKLK